MNQPAPTLVEEFGRWTFSYFVREPAHRGEPFFANAEIHEGRVLRARFMLSRSGDHIEMVQRLRSHCEEWAKDRDDPSRIDKRNERTIGDRIKAGQAGEKGVA
ncbi:hypothetical protein [Variovorax boronicumulans]|uniref:hypothetical protein n=1 Tax=Variovorax boronicumulans TaxID=436515 RepID=UPI0033923612